MSSTITRTQNQRALLAATSLGVNAQVTITALTSSGTTATATTGTTPTVGDTVLITGSDHPLLNGPMVVVSVSAGVSFTYTIASSLTWTSVTTALKYQKGVVATIWGDGSTGIGALPTAEGGDVVGRVATTTAPTTACRISVYRSPTGAAGTWRDWQSVDSTTAGNDQSTHIIAVPRGGFVLVFFWRVAGTAVIVDAVGNEETSHTST